MACASRKTTDGPADSGSWRSTSNLRFPKVLDRVETDGDTAESEQTRFARQLQAALLSAQWSESQKVMLRKGAAGFQETLMATSSRGDVGVILFAAPDSLAAARALNTALNRMLIRAFSGTGRHCTEGDPHFRWNSITGHILCYRPTATIDKGISTSTTLLVGVMVNRRSAADP